MREEVTDEPECHLTGYELGEAVMEALKLVRYANEHPDKVDIKVLRNAKALVYVYDRWRDLRHSIHKLSLEHL